MKKGDYNKNGFTIIEVSLVLAIAGLIFLMVFIALPQLQRSQRDSRRRDDIITFLETVKKYQTNNRGALPTGTGGISRPSTEPADKTSWAWFYWGYIDDGFADPDGTDYTLVLADCNANKGVKCKNYPSLDSVDHKFHIYTKATCDGAEAVGTSNPRSIALLYRLEGSGVYCNNT